MKSGRLMKTKKNKRKAKRKKSQKKKDFYIDAKAMSDELMAWKKCGVMSDKLGKMILAIVNGLGQKKNFSGYTYLEDMKGLALEFLVKYARNFDARKKNANAFSYCTQIAYCGFIQYIQKEQKQSKIRQKLYDDLVTQGGMMEMSDCPFELYVRNSGESNRIKDELISDLIEEYDAMIAILKQEAANKVNVQNDNSR